MKFDLTDLKVYISHFVAFVFNIPYLEMDLSLSEIFSNIHNLLAIILLIVTIIYTLTKLKGERNRQKNDNEKWKE